MLKSGLVWLILIGAVACVELEDDSATHRKQSIAPGSGAEARTFQGSQATLALIALAVIVGITAILTILGGWLTLGSSGEAARSGDQFSLTRGFGTLMQNVYSSVDVVEMALKYMSVEEEACKYKAVCKAEQAAIRNPIASLAINTINSNLSGLSKYASAVEAGLSGEDCDLLYDACLDTLSF